MTAKRKPNYRQASHLIRQARRILVVTHVAPDGDAVGSLLGLGRALRALGKTTMLACPDPVPHRFHYLPGHDTVVQQAEGLFDLVVALDCSDAGRMGHIYDDRLRHLPLVNIDHHVTNLEFGTVNLVELETVSTSQIVFELLPELGVELDGEIATCLLNGLVTDTQGFRTANVTPRVMEVALQLMRAGASLTTITHHALNRRPARQLRLWAAGLTAVRVQDRVIWTTLTLANRRAASQEDTSDAGLSNFLASVEEADVAVVFSELEQGEIEVSFRAAPGFDVAGVALGLGGGGHALAAGCRLQGPLEKVQQCVLTALQADLARQGLKRKT